MNPIPFDQIGPTQVGRLVYQVMGKSGPIFNPTNIRYLDPTSSGIDLTAIAPIAGAVPALAGVAGLTLAASVASVALSAAAVKKCVEIQKSLTRIEARLGKMSDQLNRIEQRVERIDVKVAETHLREAVKHIKAEAITEDEIDLAKLSRLYRDLDAFRNSYEGPTLFNFSLQLTSDVRDRLEELLQFLQSLRVATVIAHNGTLDGDPYRVIHADPIGDYLGCPLRAVIEVATAIGRDDKVFFRFIEKLGEHVENRFLWAGESENEEFQQFCVEHYFKPQNEAMSTTVTAAAAMCLTMGVEAAAPDLDYDSEESEDALFNLAKTWFLESDASVVYRLTEELRALSEGYENVFYPGLKESESDSESESSPTDSKSLFFQVSIK